MAVAISYFLGRTCDPPKHAFYSRGFLPVSLDHRLCPEVSLSEGPMVDICDALEWARNTLPHMKLQRSGLQIDGERVVVVGWSSGGQLAMSLSWTAPQRGLRPPEAVLAFYCPTDYEDEWWRHPIQPIGAEDKGFKYNVIEAIQDEPHHQLRRHWRVGTALQTHACWLTRAAASCSTSTGKPRRCRLSSGDCSVRRRPLTRP